MTTSHHHHTVRSYDAELEEVTRRILAMGGLVEAHIKGALDALVDRDLELAERIVANDQRIDDLEREVDELVTRILALRQPMAEDLRRTKTALKIASNLERIGDLAANIGKRCLALEEPGPPPQREALRNMGTAVYGMVSDVLNAYRDEDPELARAVWRQDEEVDEMYISVFRGILDEMIADTDAIAIGIQLHFVAKNIERMGDHATNIAEMVTYMILGTLPEDERPKGQLATERPDR